MTANKHTLRLLMAVIIILTSAGYGNAAVDDGAAARPNILLILADDMGWSDVGCYGGEIATPNIDSLAANGVRFLQMHNTSKCFPSRACLLTGVYAQQCGMGKKPLKIINAVTLGEVLKSAGYRTLASGKHHSTESLYDRGFDRYFGMRDGAGNHFNPGLQRDGEGKPAQKGSELGRRYWCVDNKTMQRFTPDKDFYSTDAFTDYALGYLEEYKSEDKPFFLYLAYTAPHDPLMAWPEDIAKYEGVYTVGYDVIRKSRYARQKEMGLINDKFQLSEPTHADWDKLSDEQKTDQARRMQVYAAMVDRMDQNIGRVLEKLKSLGEFDNTLIVFASDNGSSAEDVQIGSGEIGTVTRWASLQKHWANVGNTPFRMYKNYSFEGGINTPMIAHWPSGIKAPGRQSDFAGHFIDFMPTFIEIAGANYPDEFNGDEIVSCEGESFAKVFDGEDIVREKPIFWQWKEGKAVRNGKWKLVTFSKKWELYDMEIDRTETNDLAETYPEVVAEMAEMYRHWIE